MPDSATTLNGAFPIVPYPDPRAAIGWLEGAFGAVATEVHPPDPAEPLQHAGVRLVQAHELRRIEESVQLHGDREPLRVGGEHGVDERFRGLLGAHAGIVEPGGAEIGVTGHYGMIRESTNAGEKTAYSRAK